MMLDFRKTLPLTLLLAACSGDPADGDAGDAGTADTSQEDVSPLPDFVTGVELAARDFGPDPYEIGREWYVYDGTTHAVTPEPWVYVIERDAQTWAVDIGRYYDDRGESGKFTLSIAEADGAAWSEAVELSLEQNVKDAPACVKLQPAAEVACTAPHDLVFRTAWRSIPDAGFAVREPAIYMSTHFADTAEPFVVRIVEAAEIADVSPAREALDAVEPRPSVAVDPLHGRVGWVHDAPGEPARTETQVQITSNLQVAQWQIASLTASESATTVTLAARCQNLNVTEQPPFPAEATSFDVTLSHDTPYSARLVQLCDPAAAGVVSGSAQPEFSTPLRGLWPDAKTFDLIVEQLDERVVIRLANGHLLWNWTRAYNLDPSAPFDPIDLEAVWDKYLSQ